MIRIIRKWKTALRRWYESIPTPIADNLASMYKMGLALEAHRKGLAMTAAEQKLVDAIDEHERTVAILEKCDDPTVVALAAECRALVAQVREQFLLKEANG